MRRYGTFEYIHDENGRATEAIGYYCIHENIMHECQTCDAIDRIVGLRMIDYWNGSFVQMRERLVTRDRLIRGE